MTGGVRDMGDNKHLKDNPDYEVVTKGYADFEEYGVYYRRKRKLWLDLNKEAHEI